MAENVVLAALTPADRDLVSPHLRRLHLKTGDVLFEFGDPAASIYFPISALVTLFAQMKSGRAIACTMRGCDGAIGFVEAASNGEMFCRGAVQIGGDVLCLPSARYREAYNESVTLRDVMNRRAHLMLADARQSAACNATHHACGRLARTLLECHHHTGDSQLLLTHELLGDLTGLGRTTLSHWLSDMSAHRLIENTRGVIELLDLKGLKARACECYALLRAARKSIAL